MILTKSQLQQCVPGCKNADALLGALNLWLPLYKIESVTEVAAFVAQCGHESIDFNRFEENMNYSADGLRKTWPKRFLTDETANEYARKPEKIANKVYADRMGNGNEASGDGWKYHGRGAIQLTGKNSYAAFAKYKTLDIFVLPVYLLTVEGAIDSACWYWTTNELKALSGNIEALTKKINGGLIGLPDRKARFGACLKALNNI